MRILAALMLALVCAHPANATPFSWVVQGQISTVNQVNAGQYAGLFAVGQPYALLLTMESTAPDLDPSPSCGSYQPIRSMTFTSGAVSLSASPLAQEYIVNPSGSGPCNGPLDNIIRIRSDFSRPGSPATLAFELNLFITLSSLSDALLIDPRVINGAIVDLFPVRSENGVPPAFARSFGATVSPVAAVPEPGSLLLAGLALAGARLRYQHRRSFSR